LFAFYSQFIAICHDYRDIFVQPSIRLTTECSDICLYGESEEEMEIGQHEITHEFAHESLHELAHETGMHELSHEAGLHEGHLESGLHEIAHEIQAVGR
jgi:hypothetical protein